MKIPLIAHQDFLSPEVTGLGVDIVRTNSDSVLLQYMLEGNIAALAVPETSASERRDNLWQQSCVELFVRVPGQSAYFEFNLSPSTAWAAYRFSDYRQGMAPADLATSPVINCHRRPALLHMQVLIALSDVPELAAAAQWHIGLSAVVEDRAGDKSYWALAHPEAKPDFHHDICFAQTLARGDL
jgi:hypothetical protein